MKKFCITLTHRSDTFLPHFSDEIEGDDLLEVISKFILVIARLHKRLLDESYRQKVEEDDIPF